MHPIKRLARPSLLRCATTSLLPSAALVLVLCVIGAMLMPMAIRPLCAEDTKQQSVKLFADNRCLPAIRVVREGQQAEHGLASAYSPKLEVRP